jgi:hypothetical protein
MFCSVYDFIPNVVCLNSEQIYIFLHVLCVTCKWCAVAGKRLIMYVTIKYIMLACTVIFHNVMHIQA